MSNLEFPGPTSLPDATVIRGRRTRAGAATCAIGGNPVGADGALWQTSLCIASYAPSGPDWGDGGPGPAQLALALLLLVTDSDEAERFHPLFRDAVLAGIQADDWTLTLGDIRRWLGLVRIGIDPSNTIRRRNDAMILATQSSVVDAAGTLAICLTGPEELAPTTR